MCSDGVHRKTVVEMRCLHSSDPNTSPSFLMGVIKDGCALKLIVESPLACDVEGTCPVATEPRFSRASLFQPD